MNKKKAPPKKVVAKTAPPRKEPIQYLVVDEDGDHFEFVQALSSEEAVKKYTGNTDPDDELELLVIPGYSIEKFKTRMTRLITKVEVVK